MSWSSGAQTDHAAARLMSLCAMSRIAAQTADEFAILRVPVLPSFWPSAHFDRYFGMAVSWWWTILGMVAAPAI